MEAWLLFPIRLAAALLVAAIVFCAIDGIQARMASIGPVVETQSVAEEPDPQPPSPGRIQIVHMLPWAIGMLTFAFILFLVEQRQFNKFRIAVEEIKQLDGSIEFDPPALTPLRQYFASIATVDLCDSPVDDSTLPDLRFIHNLKAIRLANTAIGKETVLELSNCRRLERVDLSQTSLTSEDLEPLARLSRKPSVLLGESNDSSLAGGPSA